MATTTTTETTTTTAAAARDAAIKAHDAEKAAREAATARGDKKGALSHGAKQANRSREIREAELEMALAGEEFTPWEKPTAVKTRREQLDPTKVRAQIEQLKKLAANAPYESVKVTASQRLEALTKAAKAQGIL